ncbi:hypothetical protein AB0E00_03055 [Streptomyces sp. NPDC048110]|uniref:hypothetical protein n=1 Tax=Streptomyces sp. NPDC048110 TaxID=3155483 RepID=UPI0033E7435F
MEQEVATLAMTGATTIVAAMATGAWENARNATVALYRRYVPAQQAAVEVQLDGSAGRVERAQDPERERERQLPRWQDDLEDFLQRNPEAAAELHALVDRIQQDLPGALQSWAQTNIARDHGIVNAVQHGSQHNYYMDSSPPVTARAEGSGEVGE